MSDARPWSAQLLQQLVREIRFPEPSEASEEGLLAYGGDLRPERLLAAYARGIFPWYDSPPILWFSPDPRTVLLPGELVVNRTLRKNLARQRYHMRFDCAFDAVVRACAQTPRPEQDGTWIGAEMREAYGELHELGFAHSAEAWDGDTLVGGIYGVSLGAAFFGESMFAHRGDASKMALVALMQQLGAWGFHFLDCQVHTDHMQRLGAQAWARERFLRALAAALEVPTRRGRWELEEDTRT